MEKLPECRVVQTGATVHGAQGTTYFEGISRESAGASGLCMHIVRIPPGAKARPHLHEQHETAIYVLKGYAETLWGDNLQHKAITREGDWLYIPAGVPHQPCNPTDEETIGIVARTDAGQSERLVLLPELENLHIEQP